MQKFFHFVPTIGGCTCFMFREWEENQKRRLILKETQCFQCLKIAQIHSIASTTYSNYKTD